MDNLLVKIENDKDFMNIISDIIENKTVQEIIDNITRLHVLNIV